MKTLIARGAGLIAVGVAAATIATMGAGVATADELSGITYGEAVEKISDMNADPVVATVNGDQVALDDCVVVSWAKSIFLEATDRRPTPANEVVLHLDCNARVAEPGRPGNSAASPEGRKAKKDYAMAEKISDNPDECYKNDDVYSYCKRICTRTGRCEIS